MELKDQLSWTEFLKESSKEKKISEVKPFNRLIAHTRNLFIISGYGAFTKGYFLIVTKDFIPSFGLINNEMLNELNFLMSARQKTRHKYILVIITSSFSLFMVMSL